MDRPRQGNQRCWHRAGRTWKPILQIVLSSYFAGWMLVCCFLFISVDVIYDYVVYTRGTTVCGVDQFVLFSVAETYRVLGGQHVSSIWSIYGRMPLGLARVPLSG